MEMIFDYNGVELSRSDFGNGPRDYVAFSIAFAHATFCRDKEAALELLYHEADKVIEFINDLDKTQETQKRPTEA